MDASNSQLDLTVQRACSAGDYGAAATAILRALGAEVVGTLHARLQRETATAEVFSQFAEDLWLGLPGFQFRCSLRAWVFTLARNAGHRYLDRQLRHERRQVPLSQIPELMAEVQVIGTHTLTGLSTQRQGRLPRLRAELSPDDQLLLTLRIDRQLDFREIAVVMLGGPEVEHERLVREAARLRKRFQLLKERLRRRWRALGPNGGVNR